MIMQKRVQSLSVGVTEVGTCVDGIGAQLFFDTEELVVLGQTLGSARSTCLDLTGLQTDD
jgi:hypothetical protein